MENKSERMPATLGRYCAESGPTGIVRGRSTEASNQSPSEREETAKQILVLLNENGLSLKVRGVGEGFSDEPLKIITIDQDDSLSKVLNKVIAKIERCGDVLFLVRQQRLSE